MAYAIRTVSPGTGDVIFEHVGITLDDARDIVDRSQAAFLSYRDLRFDKRKSIIVGALDTLDRMKAQLADELTLQMGRPITYAPAEIDTMRKRADYLIQAASGALADLPGKPEPGFKRWISKEPVGPVFIVSAWNFPYLITINTLLPALLAGNTVVLKPSPQTPLVAAKLKAAFDDAGLPKDVLQIMHTADPGVLQKVVQLHGIKQICFTGSNAGGVAIRSAIATRIVPVNLELGGNDAAYVRADADLKWTAANLVDGAIFNSGQSCCAVERVYVDASVHDDFVKEAQSALEGYKLGNPTDKATSIGPVVSHAAVQRIQAQVEDALAKGAQDATPANPTFVTLPSVGSYVAPRLLVNVSHDMEIMKQETFGPIIPIMKVTSDSEAVTLINDSEYGLTASIWTQDIELGEHLSSQLEVGTVFVNRCDCPNPDLVWIGWKNSGLGSTLGPTAFDAFTIPKSHHIRMKQA